MNELSRYSASYVDVVMGAHDISANEPEQVTVRATNLITHESYSSFTLRNDIGLIQLPSPVAFNGEWLLLFCKETTNNNKIYLTHSINLTNSLYQLNSV